MSAIVYLYLELIKSGELTIEKVPKNIRNKVEELLKQED